jgi:hypothetical protein
MMKKYLKLTFCLIILGTALIPLVATIGKVNSINLDRNTLAPMPQWIDNGKLNLSFTSQFDDFYTEQFSFRTYLISIYNGIYERVFHLSGNENVIVGKDGFLFFEETLDDHLKTTPLNIYDLNRFNEILRIQKEYLSNQSIDSFLMIVPNKATIYAEYMPSNLKPFSNADIFDQLENIDLNMKYIDVKSVLLEGKKESDAVLYHKRDSHWNNLGAAIGYRELMKALNRQPLELDDQQPEERDDWQGDLARMLYPAIPTNDPQFYFKLPQKFIFSRAIRSMEDLEIESVHPEMEGRLVLFRDSFANALIPFVSESFQQVSYFRQFPMDYRRIEGLDADTLILQIAQRNVNWYLQATPMLPSNGKSELLNTQLSTDISFTISIEKNSDLSYINARYDDQKAAQKITAVKIFDQGLMYDAFPIFQDGDFEDDKIELGFSLYTVDQLNPDTMIVYVQMDGRWYKTLR